MTTRIQHECSETDKVVVQEHLAFFSALLHQYVLGRERVDSKHLLSGNSEER